MLFNSPEYFIFLACCLILYFCLPHRAQNGLLLGASYLFSSFWDYRFLSLIILSTVVDYWAGRSIAAAREANRPRSARRALLVSLVVNLGVLACFKYYGFFVTSLQNLLAVIDLSISAPLLEIVLPVGISFYTFQTLSYTIDIYRGEVEPVRRPLDFALFVAFFPQLVAGPIERARRLLPQILEPRQVTPTDLREGCWLLLIGLFRKVVIADTAALWVDRYFANPGAFTSLELAAGLFLYALQIYGDFSGYSNMARGTARLFGFRLVRNFRHPYFAASFSDFWRRWHISLSTWLRDYLYIPLGGNRKGRVRTYLNVMVTMLLGGLWHGASWNFVGWGCLHGLYLAVERRLGLASVESLGQVRRALRTALVFVLVCFTWLFFRSTDTATTGTYLAFLVEGSIGTGGCLIPCGILALLTLAIDTPQAERGELWMGRLPRLVQEALATLLIVVVLFSGTAKTPFIYFQF